MASSSGAAPRPTHSGIAVASSILALVVAVLVAVAVGPQPMHLGFQTTGDAALAASVRGILGADGSDESTAGYRSLSVVSIEGGTTRWSGLGNRGDGQAPTIETSYELGSITKLFTGLLLADAVDRGEVLLADTIETYLPSLAGHPAGDATLEELATHRSGLPAYADEVTAATYEGFGHSDVEAITQAVVVDQAVGLALSGRGRYQYSNLGVSLLGYGLAAASGSGSWTDLVTSRILDPAGMTHTSFAGSRAEVPESAAVGCQLDGLVADYSVGPGYFPAGTATFTTAGDLAAFASWVLDGKAAGLAALAPRFEVSATAAIGLVWMTSTAGSLTMVGHNGSVPGFASTLWFDLAGGRAVAVLGNTDAGVEGVGRGLLDPTAATGAGDEPWGVRGIAAVALLALAGCVFAAGRLRSVLAAAAVGLLAQTTLVLFLRFAEWQRLPGWIWAAGAALVGAATILGAARGTRSRGAAIAAVVVGLVASVVVYGVTIWVAG